MEGSGVTNYDINKPSFAISNATTEWEDALLQRNIVSSTQVLLAKGASLSEAQRLIQMKQQKQQQQNDNNNNESDHSKQSPFFENHKEQEHHDDDDDDSYNYDDSDDEEVLQRYREERKAQLISKYHSTKSSSSCHQCHYYYNNIQRSEWKQYVNDDSHHRWVIVCLTSHDTERTGRLEQVIYDMAHTTSYSSSSLLSQECLQFVTIPYQHAIHEQWPLQHLPCLFLYRYGKVQKQYLALSPYQTMETVYELIAQVIPKNNNKEEEEEE